MAGGLGPAHGARVPETGKAPDVVRDLDGGRPDDDELDGLAAQPPDRVEEARRALPEVELAEIEDAQRSGRIEAVGEPGADRRFAGRLVVKRHGDHLAIVDSGPLQALAGPRRIHDDPGGGRALRAPLAPVAR